MNASNSSGEAKWVAWPDTTCSTRPARRPWATSASACTCTRKARCAGRGWTVSASGFTCTSSHAIVRFEGSRRHNSTPGPRGKSSAKAQVFLKFLSGVSQAGAIPTEDGLMDEAWRVDWANECVWHGRERVRLPPKVFAVLRLLVEHTGQLVTKEVLLQAVWPDTVVSEAMLTTCMGELRKALGATA